MATTNPNDPPEDEDNPAFLKYLEKNLPWLTEKLKIPSGSSVALQKDPIAEFLKAALDKSEAARDKLAEQMEAVRELLTPEQLTLLKSLKSAGAGDPANPPPNDPPGNPPKPPAPPSPDPVKKKSRWL